MKKYLILLSLTLLSVSCTESSHHGMTVPTDIVYLYPNGQGVDCGIVEDGVQVTCGPLESTMCEGEEMVDSDRVYSNTGDQARMEIYIPEKCNGQMVVNCPGGGYMCTCCQSEGDFAAEWFTAHGIAVCTLIYREPYGHAGVPLRDIQNAFRYCRYHAAEWGVKQIGVIGYSAGGHLAASASTLFVDDITRPDFAILIYPWISNVDFITDAVNGSRDALLKGQEHLYGYYSLEYQVKENTPRTAIFLSSNDIVVPPEHSWAYYNALRTKGVPAEIHIYPYGFHGWGFNTYETAGYDMLEDYRASFFYSLETFLSETKKISW